MLPWSQFLRRALRLSNNFLPASFNLDLLRIIDLLGLFVRLLCDRGAEWVPLGSTFSIVSLLGRVVLLLLLLA